MTADQSTLLNIKAALSSPSALSSWTTDTSNFCVSWYGVVCSGQQVTNLKLPSLGLSGQFPGTLVAQLPALQALDFSNNNGLTGSIPPQISVLFKLTFVNWATTSIAGVLPAQLSTLTALNQITIHDTKLGGPVPAQFSTLTQLVYLQLWNNAITGTLPPQLSTLINLASISFQVGWLVG